MKKPYDPAQRWRTLKNMARAFKNPMGFAVWRFAYKQNNNTALSYWYLGSALMVWAIVSQLGAKQKSTINVLINSDV